MRSITKEHHLIDVSLVSFSFLPIFSSIYRHFASSNLASTAIHVLWSSCSIFRGSCILALFLSLSLNGLPSFDPNNRIPYSWQCFRQSKETKEACVHLHEHPTFEDPRKELEYLRNENAYLREMLILSVYRKNGRKKKGLQASQSLLYETTR